MDHGTDIKMLVENSEFGTKWSDFLKLLVDLHCLGLSEREIGAHFAEQEVIWVAHVKKLNLTRELAQGIDLSMGTPHMVIDENRYLTADHVVLHFQNDVPESWHKCQEGSLIKFRARFGSNAGIRPAVGLSQFNSGKKLTLKLGLRKGQLQEVLKEGDFRANDE